jgi:hypothetical protein
MNTLNVDIHVNEMARAKNKEEFGRAFLGMQNVVMPEWATQSGYDAYVTRTGEALFSRLRAPNGKRRRPSDAKRAFLSEAELFKHQTDWRASNPALAARFSEWLADIADEFQCRTSTTLSARDNHLGRF